jgi:hypothetical protein
VTRHSGLADHAEDLSAQGNSCTTSGRGIPNCESPGSLRMHLHMNGVPAIAFARERRLIVPRCSAKKATSLTRHCLRREPRELRLGPERPARRCTHGLGALPHTLGGRA